MGAASSAAKLTKEEVAVYENEFKAADKDGNGYLTKEELVTVFQKMGAVTAEALAENYIAAHDTSGDGRVSWKEFLDIYAKQRAERAERFEETVVALTDRYKAAKPGAEGIAKADVPALVAALESAGELQMGFANSIQYKARTGEATHFTLEALVAIVRELTFADDKLKASSTSAAPAEGASAGAGATA